ncbi:hypothetical protein MARPO_0369s0001 [Marchantia polymorpha]|uniref:Uncharacterized protein n=1 Tax=Marchantia polymorpha TaxID=3197 RepID=A0A2R6VYW0_MARPO|nr:hypothetical protein MARPO_0369s0001 [Marchantia polymorpha]|eukprot:PTQ26788.1 hypothetical protein MARPO_0369s0001 [Marchantia polymorpha]
MGWEDIRFVGAVGRRDIDLPRRCEMKSTGGERSGREGRETDRERERERERSDGRTSRGRRWGSEVGKGEREEGKGRRGGGRGGENQQAAVAAEQPRILGGRGDTHTEKGKGRRAENSKGVG